MERVGRWLAIAALLPLGGGCGGDAEPQPAPWAITTSQPPPPTPQKVQRSVAGTWAIVASAMDATVLQLDGSRSDGCQAGWPEAGWLDAGEATGGYAADFCGPVVGQVEGDRVTFELSMHGFNTPLHYAIDGTLSANGQRIGGVHEIWEEGPDGQARFLASGPGAAIRYDRVLEPGPFPRGPDWPQEARALWRTIELTTATVQGPYVPGERYRLSNAWTTLGGDVGNFLGTELTFQVTSSDEVTIVAGPVPKTRDDIPIRLAIHFAAREVASVEVEMPSGEVFTLQPLPRE